MWPNTTCVYVLLRRAVAYVRIRLRMRQRMSAYVHAGAASHCGEPLTPGKRQAYACFTRTKALALLVQKYKY